MNKKLILLTTILMLTLITYGQEETKTSNQFLKKDALITTNLEGVDISAFLKQLSISRKLNIVYSENIKGNISINLYEVTLEQALDAVLRIYHYQYEVINNVYYVYTKEEWEQRTTVTSPNLTKVYKIENLDLSNETNVKMLEDSITPLLNKDRNEHFKVLTATHQVVLSVNKEKQEELYKTIQGIDAPPPQILVEVLIVDAILSEDLNFGFDIRYLDRIAFGEVTNGTLSDNGLNFDAIEYSPSRVTTDDTTLTPALVDPPLGYARGGNGVKLGYVRNHAASFVDALEAITDVRVLASPKILALEGKEANMIIGKKIGYRTAVTTETTTTESIEFLEVGTQLRFICRVAGEYITMEIHPSQSQGALNAALLPEETTTEMNTHLRMKDGQSFVIGGLIDERTQIVDQRIPILGSIPLLGNLFKKKAEQVGKRELFVLITPYIIEKNPDKVKPNESIEQLKMNATANSFMIGSNAGRRTKKFKKAQKYYYEGKYEDSLEILKKLKEKYPADASIKILIKLNENSLATKNKKEEKSKEEVEEE